MYESDEGLYGEDYQKRGDAIVNSWGWLWEGGPEEDLEHALAIAFEKQEEQLGTAANCLREFVGRRPLWLKSSSVAVFL